MPGILLVHAHPDDETITCGGVMSLAASAGVDVTLITCTLGERGEVIPQNLAHLEGDHGALAEHRANELEQACTELGVVDHRLLGGRRCWQDSGMVATGDGVRATAPAAVDRHAFASAGTRRDQTDQLLAVIRDLRPQIVITYDATGGYGHPDHVRAHEITVGAVEAIDPSGSRISLYATVVARSELAAGLAALGERSELVLPVPPADDLPAVPDESVTTSVPLGRARAAKLAALRAHATQVTVLDEDHEPPAFALSNGLAQPVLPTEHFVLLRGPDCALGDVLAS